MKKITREQFKNYLSDIYVSHDAKSRKVEQELWHHIQSLQDELDRKELMSVEDLADMVELKQYGFMKSTMRSDIEDVCRILQPLTVQQGFVPDWSVAPHWALQFVGHWAVNIELSDKWHGEFVIPRPTPPKVKRERMATEKTSDLVRHYKKTLGLDRILSLDKIIEELDSGKTLSDLCTAAGIDLFVEE